MKTYVYTLNLRNDPDVISQYKNFHRAVWPEVKESLKSVGIINCRIYLLGCRLVNILDVIDAFDPERDFARYVEGKPIVEKWDKMMATFQECVPEAKEGEWWALMDNVFDLQA